LRGFEELGTRQPEMSALEASTGWKPTRMFDEAIWDVSVYERSRLADQRPLLGRKDCDAG